MWHGPFDPQAEEFKIGYMKELRLGEQLMPTPLITAQVDYEWEPRILKEHQKISEIFSKLSGGRGISTHEAKVMYIKKVRCLTDRSAACSPLASDRPPPPPQVRKLQMFGTTLFHVHNSKIFPSGHFLVAASSSGIQFLHPITKDELHSPFFFSDLQRCAALPFTNWPSLHNIAPTPQLLPPPRASGGSTHRRRFASGAPNRTTSMSKSRGDILSSIRSPPSKAGRSRRRCTPTTRYSCRLR